MQFIGKAITFIIIVGITTLLIEAIMYEREVLAKNKQERPFYE
jgi:TM2 domain-containing membrane protein YozV